MSATSRKAAKREARKAAKQEKQKRLTLAQFPRKGADYDFIGARVIKVEDGKITAIKEDKVYIFCLEDEGSWSDWWEINTKLYIPKHELKNAPVITGCHIDGKRFCFTLFGLDKAICEINAEFHNDSGWNYGCTCRVFCNEHELAVWYG